MWRGEVGAVLELEVREPAAFGGHRADPAAARAPSGQLGAELLVDQDPRAVGEPARLDGAAAKPSKIERLGRR